MGSPRRLAEMCIRDSIEGVGAALHPQLVAGAAVEAKAGVARADDRAGVAVLDGAQLGAAAGPDAHVLLPQQHKAAGEGLGLQYLGDAGLDRPARPGRQGDAHRVEGLPGGQGQLTVSPGEVEGHQPQMCIRDRLTVDWGAPSTAAISPTLSCW